MARRWTEQERNHFRRLWLDPTLPTSTISRRLHRSHAGLRQQAKKLGICRLTELLSATQAGEILGVSHHTVRTRIEEGLLKGRLSEISRAHRKIWYITYDDLERFVLMHPEAYDYRLLRDTYWRKLALQALTKWAERSAMEVA